MHLYALWPCVAGKGERAGQMCGLWIAVLEPRAHKAREREEVICAMRPQEVAEPQA